MQRLPINFLFLFFFLVSSSLLAQQTYFVTNANDSGAGSLRQAILTANADNIAFSHIDLQQVAGSTIVLTSQLPDITADGLMAYFPSGTYVSGNNLVHSPAIRLEDYGYPFGTPSIFIDFLPSNLVISNTNDNGPGSFRQALYDGNTTLVEDSISFDIPGPAPHTISLLSELPLIEASLVIDGTTQAANGYIGNSPYIVLTRNAIVNTCLKFYGENIEVYGLLITGFSKGMDLEGQNITIGAPGKRNVLNKCTSYGILVESKGGDVRISNNFIGVNVVGDSTTATVNSAEGISMNVKNENYWWQEDNPDVLIENNVMAGGFKGILIDGVFEVIKIDANTIGTNAAGTYLQGEYWYGIEINGEDIDSISISGNLVSGCMKGVVISYAKTNKCLIVNNKIGTDVTGSYGLPNKEGLQLFYCKKVQVGLPGEGNLISGNTEGAIFLLGDSASVFMNNLIGTDKTGSYSIYNSSFWGAVKMNSCISTQFGTSVQTGNIVSGNLTKGISISGSEKLSFKGNRIGVNAFGDSLGNYFEGIHLQNSNYCEFGGEDILERNIIACNQEDGIRMENYSLSPGAQCRYNRVSKNQFYNNGEKAVNLTLFDANVANDAFPKPTFDSLSNGIIYGTSLPDNKVQLFYTLHSDKLSQGHTFLGEVNADSFGHWQYAGAFHSDSIITALAIDSVNGNSSEFGGACYQPDASFSFIHFGLTYIFETAFHEGNYYSWYFGDGDSVYQYPYGNHFYHQYNDTSYYTVTLVVENPCGTAVSTQVVYVNDNLSVNDFEQSSIRIFPNPADQSVKINSIGLIGNEFVLNDFIGNRVYSTPLYMDEMDIPRNNLPGGIYFYEIVRPNGTKLTGKIVFI